MTRKQRIAKLSDRVEEAPGALYFVVASDGTGSYYATAYSYAPDPELFDWWESDKASDGTKKVRWCPVAAFEHPLDACRFAHEMNNLMGGA